jgi:alanine-synthesizing transaminase
LVLDLLTQEKVLVVQGTAFNWPYHDHLRLVTLPRVDELEDAMSRIARFLVNHRG